MKVYRTTRGKRAERIGDVVLRFLPEMTDAQFDLFLEALAHSSIEDVVGDVAFAVGVSGEEG